MKKLARFFPVFLIFGWFFAIEMDHPEVKGAKIYMQVGPFEVKGQCKIEYDLLTATLDAAKQDYSYAECTYKQES